MEKASPALGGVKLMVLMPMPYDQQTHRLDDRVLLEPSHDQNATARDHAEGQTSQHRVGSLARLRRCACGCAVAL